MDRAQRRFAVFALLVVCSLVAASVGTFAVQVLLNDDADPAESGANPSADLIAELRGDIARNPEDVESMSLLGELLAYDGQLDEAITWYEQALAIDPNNSRVRLSFSRALKDCGKRADAELQFRRVLETEPGSYEAHYYLADLYRSWEPPRLDEAAAHYRQVIEIAPTAYLAELSREQLVALGYALPATPGATPPATPVAAVTEESG